MSDQDSINGILKPFIQPWYDSLENPMKSQEKVLTDLLAMYRLTDYGKRYNASELSRISDYQANFPIINYSGLVPILNRIKEASCSA